MADVGSGKAIIQVTIAAILFQSPVESLQDEGEQGSTRHREGRRDRKRSKGLTRYSSGSWSVWDTGTVGSFPPRQSDLSVSSSGVVIFFSAPPFPAQGRCSWEMFVE